MYDVDTSGSTLAPALSGAKGGGVGLRGIGGNDALSGEAGESARYGLLALAHLASPRATGDVDHTRDAQTVKTRTCGFANTIGERER